MHLELAEEKHRESVIKMATRFYEVSPFSGLSLSISKMNSVFDLHLNDKTSAIIILLMNEELPVGMIIGVASSPMFTEEKVATELAWWVDEEYRGHRRSFDLTRAFEDWAVRIGCKMATLALLPTLTNPKVFELYNRLGFHESEVSFLKEFK